ncbi:hypothetical protein [Chelativorans alearense]|uniref:hypothetical protein n=1 Tax=Chelativorans alearense TaxID=2681495 RepID=UPI0013D7B130|nr:hypothetical protein [Chelativorans alearense]
MLNPKHTSFALLLAGLLGLGTIVLPAAAHHGFTGAYDATSPLYVEGTVEAVTLAYPHVEMTVAVPADITVPDVLPGLDVLGIPDAQAKIAPIEADTYDLQMAGTEFVTDLADRIQVNDRVSLVALRNCLPPHEIRSRWIRVASGDVVTVAGETQAEVQGCD